MANSNSSTSLYVYQPKVSSTNFTTLYTDQPTINPTAAYGNANVEAFLNLGTDGSNIVNNVVIANNLTVGANTNLGNVGNVHIQGGNLNYVLSTDGSGNLIWEALPSYQANVTSYISFAVGANGNNQTFTNSNLIVYSNANVMNVFKNGVNLEPTYYVKSGSTTLQINIPLTVGDTIDVLASEGGSDIIPGGNITEVQYNGGSSLLSGNSTFTFTQANSLLTVGNLTVSNNSILGSNANVKITGGSANYILKTDGTGNLSWIAQAGSNTAPGGSNTDVQFNDGNILNGTSALTFNKTTNTLSATYFSGDGSNITNIAANSVIGIVGNANYSAYAGNAVIANSANTAGTATTAGTANTANYASNANVANYATTSGNANFATYSTSATTANTVIASAQPNITSLGTLTGLTVSGNIGATFYTGNGYYLTGISTSGTPGGANTQIQYNNSGSFGGIANLTFNQTTNTFTTYNIVGTNSNIANTVFNKFNETVVAGGNVSGTITPNAAAGTIYEYTLTGNITLNSLANAVAGTSMTIVLNQDSTGGRTLTSSMKFAGGSKTLSVAASATDIISLFYDGTTYYAVLSKGYA